MSSLRGKITRSMPDASRLLSPRVALVAGGIRTSGRVVERELAKDHRVITISRPIAPGAEVAVGHGEIVECDLTLRDDRAGLIAGLRTQFAGIDLLVNVADEAFGEPSDFLEDSEERFDDVLSASLKGLHFLSQAVARWMLEQKGGRIVFVIPVMSGNAGRGLAESVSHAGLSMSRLLYAHRLAAEGIQVFEVRQEVEPITPQFDALRPAADLASVIRSIADGKLDYLAGQALFLGVPRLHEL